MTNQKIRSMQNQKTRSMQSQKTRSMKNQKIRCEGRGSSLPCRGTRVQPAVQRDEGEGRGIIHSLIGPGMCRIWRCIASLGWWVYITGLAQARCIQEIPLSASTSRGAGSWPSMLASHPSSSVCMSIVGGGRPRLASLQGVSPEINQARTPPRPNQIFADLIGPMAVYPRRTSPEAASDTHMPSRKMSRQRSRIT